MSRELGPSKQSRAAADASMLVELQRRAIEAVTYSQRTNLNKPVFYYNIPSILTGSSAVFGLDRVIDRTGSSPAPAPAPAPPPEPTYSVVPNIASVDEGTSVVFTVTTTDVADGTTLYWTTNGTASADDFSDGNTTGTVTITGNTGTITRALELDAIASETETFTIQIRTGSVSGSIVATSGTVSIVDKTAVYAVSESTTSVNEGSSVTFTVTTANVADGTTLYWTTSGTTAASDFSDDTASGSFTITSNSGSIVRTLKSDLSTEGSETFTLSVRTGSTSGTVVATSNTVTINDTSVTPTANFSWGEQLSSPAVNYTGLRTTSGFSAIIMTRATDTDGAEGPYISTDNGATFTRQVTGMSPFGAGIYSADVCVARSNGLIMYAANRGTPTESTLWKSTNGGANWSSISPVTAVWTNIVCSADGQVVLAANASSANASYSQRCIYSTNGGSTWSIVSAFSGQYERTGFDMSADGTRMYVINLGANTLPMRRSTNTGSTWSTITGSFRFYRVRCSDDGLTVIAARAVSSGTTYPYISKDGGTTWNDVTGVPARANWGDCAISGDGQTIAVSSGSLGTGTIWASADGGTTWSEQTSAGSRLWLSMAINSNGTRIVAGGTSIRAWVGTR